MGLCSSCVPTHALRSSLTSERRQGRPDRRKERGNTIKFLALFHPFRVLERFRSGGSREGHQLFFWWIFPDTEGEFPFFVLVRFVVRVGAMVDAQRKGR